MARRSQRVWLGSQVLGTLSSTSRSAVAFEYADAVLDEMPMNVPYLSCSLPVRPGRQNARAFMAGLLPEGAHRRALAERAGCLTTDVFGLLDRFGQDVAGAVVIGERVAHRPRAAAMPYDEVGLVDEVLQLADRPLALHDDSELSIAGLQDKMLLVESADGGWARPVHGYPSTHILKVDDRAHPGLVQAEHTALSVARAAGIPAAESRLEAIGGVDCLIVTRFDRQFRGASTPLRVHQEDACQALGIDLERTGTKGKYEEAGGPGLLGIAALLAAWTHAPQAELLALLDQVVFTVAIGNADAHGKNVAFLHLEPGAITLAPLFDTVPTGLWPSLRTRAAMSVGAAVDLHDVTSDDLVNEALRWGLPERASRPRVDDAIERLLHACATVENVGPHDTIGWTTARLRRLRDSTRR